MNIREKARVFATAAHAAVGQKRKYTGEDYIVHPIEVAEIVSGVSGVTDEMIAAAYLHDCIEDTHITLKHICEEFGNEVMLIVDWLTDISKPADGNRATRKSIDRKRIAGAPAEVHTIKLADLISNTKSIVKHERQFSRVYLEEKKQLIDVLTRGDITLREMAIKLVVDSEIILSKKI